jgi:tetratricopeptide (TPR) repeat protein
MLEGLHLMGLLCVNQGKLVEAKQMYDCALQGQEVVFGPKHKSTLTTINDLGVLFYAQRELCKAKRMYKKALQGRATELGENESSTLQTVNNLAALFEEGKPAYAERMYMWAHVGSTREGANTWAEPLIDTTYDQQPRCFVCQTREAIRCTADV